MADGDSFAGQTALVTGGTRGIGIAIAHQLAREDATVVVTGLDEARGLTIAESLAHVARRCEFIRCDAGDASDVANLMQKIRRLTGSLDVLVNNAGIEVPESEDGPTDEDWERLFRTNVKGVWLHCREALPLLIATHGAIVNIASAAGLGGVADAPAYAASKAAVVSLTRSLAISYAPKGVRVNAVCPGPVVTDMTTDEWAATGDATRAREEAIALCPIGRVAQTEEVAGISTFLAGSQASFITGAIVPVDGGKTAGVLAGRYSRA